MNGSDTAFVGAQIHDGFALLTDHALVFRGDTGTDILPRDALPGGCVVETLKGGVILPGFVDLQVNGGGGVMFNDDQSVGTLRKMSDAHGAIGTAAILPTLITDTPQRTRAAIDAVRQAIAAGIDRIIGIHLEGPHLSVARKGAHDPNLIRAMTDADLEIILAAAADLPNVMVTVAPENTSRSQIRAMADAGVVVSLGHTDADFDTCLAAFDAGARCVTHLFNAMSQMGNRTPGLVGATLMRDDVYAGLIADGIHVHPATIKIALAAKAGSDQVFLVTDAMASAGSSIATFAINGRRVTRQDRRLTLEDGTLAGADLEMGQALAVMQDAVGEDLVTSVRRATSVPAGLLPHAGGYGRITAETRTVLYLQSPDAKPAWLSRDQA